MASNEPGYSVVSNSLSVCPALLSNIENGRQKNMTDGPSELLPNDAQHELKPCDLEEDSLDNVHGFNDNMYKDIIQESKAPDEVSRGVDYTKHTQGDESYSSRTKNVTVVSAPSQSGEDSQSGAEFVCGECGREFNNPWFYRQHCRIHTGERPYECKYCGKSFRQSSALYVHERIHTGEKRYSCHICKKTFGRRDTLKTHLYSHTDEKPYKCSFCNCRFRHRHLRIIHEKVHKNDSTSNFTSNDSGMISKQEIGLRNHQQESGVVMKCAECGIVCPTLSAFRIHRKQMHHVDLYTCKECGISFSTETNLKKHCPCKRSNQTLFECKGCARTFNSLQDLGTHDCSKISTSSFTCNVCGQIFNRKDQWKIHRLRHSEKETFQCSQCDMIFKANKNLLRHMSVHMSLEGSCQVLSHDVNSMSTVSDAQTENRANEEHLQTEPDYEYVKLNSEEQPQNDTSCNISISSQRTNSKALHLPHSRELHELSNGSPSIDPHVHDSSFEMVNANSGVTVGEKPSSRMLVCSECGNSYWKRRSYLAHLRTHRKKHLHKCKLCGMGFKEALTLTRHLRRHTDEKPFVCHFLFCSKAFSQSEALSSHLLTHNGSKQYKCTYCDEWFDQTSSRSIHEKAHNKHGVISCETEKRFAENKSQRMQLQTDGCSQSSKRDVGRKAPNKTNMFVCSECGKDFGKRSSYRAHLKNHRPERPHKCKFCGKSFGQSTTLKNHVRKHTGEKPFTCTVCKKAFSRLDSLRTHMMIHTGAKPYKCMFCDTWFNHRGSRRVHELSHSNKKPFYCEECDISFNQMSGLLMHQKNSMKPQKCVICNAEFDNMCALYGHEDTHHSSGEHVCQECGREFSKNVRLIKHQPCDPTLRHIFVCRSCKKTFDSKVSLKDHECLQKEVSDVRVVSGSEFEVAKQKFTFQTETELEEDMPSSKRNQTLIVCKKCARTFDDLQDLDGHNCSMICQISFQCDVCKQIFETEEKWKSHQLGHSEKEIFKDTQCEIVFEKKENLLGDMTVHDVPGNTSHHSVGPVEGEANSAENVAVAGTQTIEECGNRDCGENPEIEFFTADFEVKVKEEDHPDVLPNQSPDEFHVQNMSPIIMNVDFGQNMGGEPSSYMFTCPECGKGFGKNNYIAHLRTHRPEREFKCSVCPSSFKRKYQLKSHMCLHTGESDFQCVECTRPFRVKSELKTHLKKYHKYTGDILLNKFEECIMKGTLMTYKTGMLTT